MWIMFEWAPGTIAHEEHGDYLLTCVPSTKRAVDHRMLLQANNVIREDGTILKARCCHDDSPGTSTSLNDRIVRMKLRLRLLAKMHELMEGQAC